MAKADKIYKKKLYYNKIQFQIKSSVRFLTELIA